MTVQHFRHISRNRTNARDQEPLHTSIPFTWHTYILALKNTIEQQHEAPRYRCCRLLSRWQRLYRHDGICSLSWGQDVHLSADTWENWFGSWLLHPMLGRLMAMAKGKGSAFLQCVHTIILISIGRRNPLFAFVRFISSSSGGLNNGFL